MSCLHDGYAAPRGGDASLLGDAFVTVRAPRARRSALRSKAGGGTGWPRD